MSNFNTTTIKSSLEGSTSLKPPCSVTEETLLPEVAKCCRVLGGMFHRSNIESIMSLMKYSLDLSNPWVTQYYQMENEDHDKQTLGDNRDIYKFWLTMSDNRMLDLFLKDERHNFLGLNG